MVNPVVHLIGTVLQAARPVGDSGLWHFEFSGEIVLGTESPWRLVSKDRMELGSQDHGQKFGHAQEVNAPAFITSLLGASEVVQAEVIEPSGDLHISFANGMQLHVVAISSGYEAWQLNGPGAREVIRTGGGKTWKID